MEGTGAKDEEAPKQTSTSDVEAEQQVVKRRLLKRVCTEKERELLLHDKVPEKKATENKGNKKRGKKQQQGQNKEEEKKQGGQEELTEAEKKSPFFQVIQSFVADPSQRTFDFEPSLNSKERAVAHSIAGKLGLEHSSAGFGRNRHITLKKPASSFFSHTDEGLVIEETLELRAYLGLSGPLISATARQDQDIVSQAYRSNRERRDGRDYHITLLTKAELQLLFQQQSQGNETDSSSSSFASSFSEFKTRMLDRAEQEVEDDWQDVGLGRVQASGKKDNNEVYFRVLDWPSGARFREALGLQEKDFHITVGFRHQDIHHVRKDRFTLVKPEDSQPQPTNGDQ
ncbi:DNA-binding protein SMUBP-2 [Balamuthia mandrillaris]